MLSLTYSITIDKAVICQKQISVEGNGYCCHRPSSNWGTNQSSNPFICSQYYSVPKPVRNTTAQIRRQRSLAAINIRSTTNNKIIARVIDTFKHLSVRNK